MSAADFIAKRKADLEAAFQSATQRQQQATAAAQQAAQEIVRIQGAYAELEALEKAMAEEGAGA